jgi:hypothetical protein
MKCAWTALVLAVACLCAACASRSSGGGVCTVPASICQASPAEPAPGSPPTCGLCPAEDLIRWIERKGCQYGPNLSCAQGQIYGYQGKSYCCQIPPYASGAAPAGPKANGAEESLLTAPGGSGERGGGKTGGTGGVGGCPNGCTAPPPGCAIKGNINRKTGDRVYHLPGQKHYDEVTIEPEAGERWFCTEDEAQASGWRKSRQ